MLFHILINIHILTTIQYKSDNLIIQVIKSRRQDHQLMPAAAQWVTECSNDSESNAKGGEGVRLLLHICWRTWLRRRFRSSEPFLWHQRPTPLPCIRLTFTSWKLRASANRRDRQEDRHRRRLLRVLTCHLECDKLKKKLEKITIEQINRLLGVTYKSKPIEHVLGLRTVY